MKIKYLVRKSFFIQPFAIVFSFIFIGVFFIGCAKKTPIKSTRTENTIGTVCTITLFEKKPEPLFDEIFAALDLLEQHVSVTIPTSDIALINDAAGTNTPVVVNDDTFYILNAAIKYAQLTKGAFDPSIGPLVKLWGIGTEDAHIPTKTQIDKAVNLVDYSKIKLDSQNKSVYLPQKGMRLDLGGIAKGYAADLIVQILNQHNSTKAIIDLGGNIYAFGEKSPATNTTNAVPWKVGVKNPFDSTGAPIVAINLINKTVVTSGVYERYFIKDGIRYHHLLDRKTGYPVRNGLMSATIITDSSMFADALSTAFFVLGAKKGIALLESLDGIEGFCVDENKIITVTSGLKTKITILDSSFTEK